MVLRVLAVERSYTTTMKAAYVGNLQQDTVDSMWAELKATAAKAGLQIYGDAPVDIRAVKIPPDLNGEGGWDGWVLRATALVDTADVHKGDGG